MYKKLILTSVFTILLSSNFFINNKIEAMNNPISKAQVIGPKSAPPTKAELKKLKCEKDKDFIGTNYCKDIKQKVEKSFFEIIWEWFLALFK